MVLILTGCGDGADPERPPPTKLDATSIHRIDLPDQAADAVVAALGAERAKGEAAARRFIAACDRGDFDGALKDAIQGPRLSGEGLPVFWAAEIQGVAGALKELKFKAPEVSRVVGKGEKSMPETGRAALPVNYVGSVAAIDLNVILAKSGLRWRVVDAVIGNRSSEAAAGDTPRRSNQATP